MRDLSMALASGILVAAAAPSGAQEATIYRDTGFAGPAVTVSGAKPDLGLSFPVNAIRVQSGRWELCPERNFRGRCITVSSSSPNLFAQYGWGGQLGSMRPAFGGSGGSGGSGGGNWGGSSQGPTLRGMAAEFFPRPADRGGRILACPGGNASMACAQRTATDWCRSLGWNRAAHTAIETERRANYLADTLCVRS